MIRINIKSGKKTVRKYGSESLRSEEDSEIKIEFWLYSRRNG